MHVPLSWLIRRAGKLTVQSTPKAMSDGLHGTCDDVTLWDHQARIPKRSPRLVELFYRLAERYGWLLSWFETASFPKEMSPPFVTQPASRFIT